MRLLITSVPLCVIATLAAADVTIRFAEGAPTDRFTITTVDTCVEGAATITIDLAGSPAGLIFDTTASGAGVQVSQPFILVAGKEIVTRIPQLADGDRSVTLTLSKLVSHQPVAFTTDVDDTIGQREITVSGAEIAGATVTLTSANGSISATFGSDAVARLNTDGCAS
jgi:hypothetical protein